ncbi:MAG: hypothetical protein ACUZ8E_10525 [Candidatus Anammoxibacter sp.]
MYDINHFTLANMTDCGDALRNLGSGAKSMEEVANNTVRFFFDNFADKQTNEKAYALVRFFKTHPYGELDAGLQEFAGGLLNGQTIPPETKCLTLLGTVGDKPAWNSRNDSNGHKAIPLISEEMVSRLPMVRHLIRQLGLDVNSVLVPDSNIIVELEKKTFNVFHVEDAAGNQYVVAQDDFVVPCGIRSVIGFGGMMASGNIFVVIMFSKSLITSTTANMFKPLALSVKLAVSPFEGKVFI